LAIGLAVQGNTVKLQTVPDQPVTGLFGDSPLQFLDLVVVEFDHLAALNIYQVIVVLRRSLFIASAAIAEIMLGEDTCLLEEAHGPIHRGDGNVGIDSRRPPVQGLDVRMIRRFRQHPRDHAALVGHLQTALGAENFEFRP
jgi:hypothetical protein